MLISRRIRAAAAAVALGAAFASAAVGSATARPILQPSDGDGPATAAHPDLPSMPSDVSDRLCRPSAVAVNYSDALDKLVIGDAQLGGLSDLAWDRHTRSYAATVDNHDDDPSRVWFLRGLSSNPQPVGDPVVLKRADGTPYTGQTADNEGLVVLPDGRFVVSSEVEPSIRIFSAAGTEEQSLPVPQRFAVAPAGQAQQNATFEGLTADRSGRTILASTEGTLSGDTGDGTFRRILVYSRNNGRDGRDHGHGEAGYRVSKQIGYRVDKGMRIPEIQEYAPGKLLIMEAAYDSETGNTVKLYAASLAGARDVSRIKDLADAPQRVLRKKLVADVTRCPDLGATSKEPQLNPLMDNYEAMATAPLRGRLYAVTLLSDDNFSPTQTTRVLNLIIRLP
jgi:hypothetical protein